MNNNLIQPVSNRQLIEQEKKHINQNIKELQRDLINASFKQSNTNGSYADLLQAIQGEREKIKQLNFQLS